VKEDDKTLKFLELSFFSRNKFVSNLESRHRYDQGTAFFATGINLQNMDHRDRCVAPIS
jgi:hypothetical protein